MKPSEHERTRGCEWWVSVVTVTVFGSLLGVFLAALRITLSAAGDGPASYPLQPPLLAPSNSKSLVGVASSSAESAEQFGQWDAPSSQTLNPPMGNDDLPRGDDHGTHDSNQHGGKKEGGAGGAGWASGLCGRISPSTLEYLQAGDFESALRSGPFKDVVAHTRMPFELNKAKRHFDWVQTGWGVCCTKNNESGTRTTSNIDFKPADGWLKQSPLMDPQSILATGSPNSIKELMFEARDKVPELRSGQSGDSNSVTNHKYRVLAISGSDFSFEDVLPKVLKLKPYFGKILWEAMQTKVAGIQACPLGFNTRYTDGVGPENYIKAAAAAEVEMQAGTKASVFAAWGKFYGVLDTRLVSRVKAIEWMDKEGSWIKKQKMNGLVPQYIAALAKHRFALSPTGNGVQSPKQMEALLVQTIPIVSRTAAHDDLARQGYPIVVVDTWQEVTPANLDLWWAKLSPLLTDARWMLLAEIWATYVIHPCPDIFIHEIMTMIDDKHRPYDRDAGTVQSFLEHLKAGTCPEFHDPATCPTMNHETKDDYACLFINKAWCPGKRRFAPTGHWPED